MSDHFNQRATNFYLITLSTFQPSNLNLSTLTQHAHQLIIFPAAFINFITFSTSQPPNANATYPPTYYLITLSTFQPSPPCLPIQILTYPKKGVFHGICLGTG
jgi:hypothetical protein